MKKKHYYHHQHIPHEDLAPVSPIAPDYTKSVDPKQTLLLNTGVTPLTAHAAALLVATNKREPPRRRRKHRNPSPWKAKAKLLDTPANREAVRAGRPTALVAEDGRVLAGAMTQSQRSIIVHNTNPLPSKLEALLSSCKTVEPSDRQAARRCTAGLVAWTAAPEAAHNASRPVTDLSILPLTLFSAEAVQHLQLNELVLLCCYGSSESPFFLTSAAASARDAEGLTCHDSSSSRAAESEQQQPIVESPRDGDDGSSSGAADSLLPHWTPSTAFHFTQNNLRTLVKQVQRALDQGEEARKLRLADPEDDDDGNASDDVEKSAAPPCAAVYNDIQEFGGSELVSLLWQIEPVSSEVVLTVDTCVPDYRIKNLAGEYLIVSQQSGMLESRMYATHFLPDELSRWSFRHANVPGLPAWALRRTHTSQLGIRELELRSSRSFLLQQERPVQMPVTVPLSIQETLLVNELILCFFGVQGHLIRIKWCVDELDLRGHESLADDLLCAGEGVRILDSAAQDDIERYFIVGRNLGDGVVCDQAFCKMVEKLLAVARIQRKVAVFIEESYSWTRGLCRQALGDICRRLMNQFHAQIVEFEAQSRSDNIASLQKLWYFLQRAFDSLQLLERLVDAAKNVRAGQMLGNLQLLTTELATSQRREMIATWLHQLSLQYTSILVRWMTKGELIDLWDESFIDKSQGKGHKKFHERDSWWFEAYALERDKVPQFMKLDIAEKILVTGKVAAALRRSQENPEVCAAAVAAIKLLDDALPTFPPTVLAADWNSAVESAWTSAQSIWLRFVVVDCGYVDVLRSIEKFMFGGRCDFVLNFFESLEADCNAFEVSRVLRRLPKLVQLAIEKSTLKNDANRSKFRTNMSCAHVREISRVIVQGSLTDRFVAQARDAAAAPAALTAGPASSEQLTNLVKTLSLGVSLTWPCDILWPPTADLKLQLVGRMVLQLRLLMWKLERAHKNYTRQMQDSSDMTTKLCGALLTLLRHVFLHITSEVVAPFFASLRYAAETSEDFDALVHRHEEALDQLLDETFLREGDILRILMKLITLGHLFETTVYHYSEYKLAKLSTEGESKEERDESAAATAESSGATEEKYLSIVKEYEGLVMKNIQNFIRLLSTEKRSSNGDPVGLLLERLQLSDWYSRF